MSVEFSEKALEQLRELLGHYPDRQAAVIPALHLAQEEFGYITQEVEDYVAKLLEIPATDVHQVFTFYTMFRDRPVGKYHIKVCESVACHIMGSTNVLDYLRKKLGIDVGQTTPDGRFTLTTVECLGACEMAPMMQVNDDFYGPLDEKKLDEILESLE
ncbi:MAG: NADH-quinone oxidoreductase subunit NuoE [Calditrichaeota bacterium]|nr:NADH-quinone oxidoreductase subunit NuoE [Calditrichota bacterium]